jgi:predicted Zn-dependent protease
MDGLIAERPNDPYFYEMKAQILYENARGTEALPLYKKSVELLPDNALLRIELAQAEIEQEDPAYLNDAEVNLTTALKKEPDDSNGWRQLGIVYGKKGDEGMASYAMAEDALLEGRPKDAIFLANKAERMMKKGGAVWLRIQDIKERAESARRDRSSR